MGELAIYIVLREGGRPGTVCPVLQSSKKGLLQVMGKRSAISISKSEKSVAGIVPRRCSASDVLAVQVQGPEFISLAPACQA